MKRELKVVGIKTGVKLFQFLHGLKNFFNSYNCNNCAYNIENSPSNQALSVDKKIIFMIPFHQLRKAGISRKCGNQDAPTSGHVSREAYNSRKSNTLNALEREAGHVERT